MLTRAEHIFNEYARAHLWDDEKKERMYKLLLEPMSDEAYRRWREANPSGLIDFDLDTDVDSDAP